MKILIIHTYYQQKGGEDAIYQQECDLLAGTEEIRQLKFHNKGGWKGALMFLTSIWNIRSAVEIKNEIKEFNPDIVHIHNWHFAMGPLVIRAIKKCNVPVVMTLHNFRLLCPSAILLHNGQLETSSVKAKFPWKAIKNKVYRHSLFQTFWLAFIVWTHKKIQTWKMVNRFIVLTDFAKNLYINSSLGISETKFITKPNFTFGGKVTNAPRKNFFLFVGRLSQEKGVSGMLEAFKKSGFELHIAGEGPLEKEVVNASIVSPNIKYLGHLDKAAVEDNLKQCTAVIFPSICYEGMPMTILEAFSLGTPVIASNMGAMSSMIRHQYNGLHFLAGDVSALTEQLAFWKNINPEMQDIYRQNSLKTYQEYYTPENNKEKLLAIYKDVIREVSH